MNEVFLKPKRERGFNCLVFDVRDGKMYGYASGNAEPLDFVPCFASYIDCI